MTPHKSPKSILSAAAPAALTLLAPAFFLSAPLHADDGTWTNLSGGAWSTPGNWSGDTIADGSGFLADFSTLNITQNRTVTLDSDRTIGSLKFADTTGSSKWTIGGSSILTLAVGAGAPTIITNTHAQIDAGLQGTQGFIKKGWSTLTLGGGTSNTISGTIYVNAGTLGFTNGLNSLSSVAAAFEVASGATLNFGVGGTPTNDITLAGGTLGIQGNTTFNGTITLTSSSTISHGFNGGTVKGVITGSGQDLDLVTTSASGTSLVVDAAIQTGTGGVSVHGSGGKHIKLEGANTYTGATTVSAGTLIMNGSITSAVTVKDGAVFGGVGSSTQDIHIEAGGVFAAGQPANWDGSANTIGTFTTTGAVSFDEGSTYSLEFNSTLATFDQIAASGFSIDNANLNLTDLGSATLGLGQVYTILDGTSSSISGTFADLAEGSVFTIGNNVFKISYLADSGQDVTLTTVSSIPEPSTWAMLGGIVSMVVATCRRRGRPGVRA